MARNGCQNDLARPSLESSRGRDLEDGLETDDIAHWFEVDPTPVFVVDADSGVLASNRRGRQLLESGSALALRGKQLSFAQFEAQNCFVEALEKVTSGATSELAVVLRCDDGHWRRVQFLRGDGLPANTAFVTIRGDPERQGEIRPVVEAFRLSFAEGKVLLHVAQGLPPKRIATRLGVSPHTVRAHLRSLYLKMHVRGMHELIREYTRLTT